jgi:hypothetical protein
VIESRWDSGRSSRPVDVPLVVHLAGGAEGEWLAFEAGDEVQAHVDAGGDAGRGDDGSGVHPAPVLDHGNARKQCAEIGHVFPVCDDRLAFEQTGPGQQERAGADRRREFGLGRGAGDPVDDFGSLQFRRVPVSEIKAARLNHFFALVP